MDPSAEFVLGQFGISFDDDRDDSTVSISTTDTDDQKFSIHDEFSVAAVPNGTATSEGEQTNSCFQSFLNAFSCCQIRNDRLPLHTVVVELSNEQSEPIVDSKKNCFETFKKLFFRSH